MSPLEIHCLLEYYAHPSDGDTHYRHKMVVKELLNNEMISEPVKSNTGSIYEITEKGTFYVSCLCSLPEPVHQWVLPSNDEWENP